MLFSHFLPEETCCASITSFKKSDLFPSLLPKIWLQLVDIANTCIEHSSVVEVRIVLFIAFFIALNKKHKIQIHLKERRNSSNAFPVAAIGFANTAAFAIFILQKT